MAPSSAFIDQLNDAEKKADYIIEEAKKNRKVLLSKAREAAEEELKAFAERRDAEYTALSASRGDGDAADALRAQTEKELSEVEADFAKHRDRTVGYVVEKVMDVQLKISSTQKQALIAQRGETTAGPKAAAVKTSGPAPRKAPAQPTPTPPAPKPEPIIRQDTLQQAQKLVEAVAQEDALVDDEEECPRGASAILDDEEMPSGGWGGSSAKITLKSIRATIGDKKMDVFVETRYGGKGMRSQVVRDGGREAKFDEEMPPIPMTPDAELVFSVGDFDKKEGKVSKEPVGDTKPIKLEELATDDDGVFEGSFELFREGRAKNTGKLFVKIEIV